jgi:hypothetical protein
MVLGDKPGVRAEEIIKTWGDDAMAGRILKAAQTPTSTSFYPQLQTTAMLPMLAPASASARLLAAASADSAGEQRQIVGDSLGAALAGRGDRRDTVEACAPALRRSLRGPNRQPGPGCLRRRSQMQ